MITFKRDKKTGEMIAYIDGKEHGAVHDMFDNPDALKEVEKDNALYSKEMPPIMKRMKKKDR